MTFAKESKPVVQEKSSRYLFKMHTIKPQDETGGGARTKVTKHDFPALDKMSLYTLRLKVGGVREPHWHPNADEMGYCLEGKVLVSIYGNRDDKETFIVEQGDVFLIPSGFLHHIENVTDKEAFCVLKFSSDNPEDFGISATLGAFSDSVLANTWAVRSEVFSHFKRSTKSSLITKKEVFTQVPEEAKYVHPNKYRLAVSSPLLINEGGSAKMARYNMWPMAKDQALYYLHLTGVGMREPHWHPETAELGYIVKGKARMSILDPSGMVESYIAEPGDIYFVPKAYPHHIENLSSPQDLEILIFFDQGMPEDIGLSGSMKSYSNEVLASALHTEPAFFDKLTKYYQDAFIVKRINPLD